MVFSLKKIFSGLSEKTASGPLSTVGIDIGGSTVKVVELEETPKAVTLRTYGELQLGPYEGKPLGEVVTLNEQHRIEAVTDVLREAGVSSRHGTLAMPLSASFLTVISLPSTINPGEDLATRVPVEARKYVPLPLTDVTLDWNELPSLGDKAAPQEVMIAAVENRALEEYRSLLTAISMTAEPSEIEAFSLLRSIWRENDTTMALIDIGARAAKLYIARDGILERLHRVGQGGQEITRRLATELKVPFEDAENQKRSYDRSTPAGAQIYKVTATVLENPLAEFRRLIEQYEARVGSPIGRIVLGGGVAATPYFAEFAQDRLGRQLDIANPFAKVAYPAFLEDTLKSIGPSFGVALGAALRQFQ